MIGATSGEPHPPIVGGVFYWGLFMFKKCWMCEHRSEVYLHSDGFYYHGNQRCTQRKWVEHVTLCSDGKHREASLAKKFEKVKDERDKKTY
jgi:hypothetical protein